MAGWSRGEGPGEASMTGSARRWAEGWVRAFTTAIRS
jgi:hypothetical protein